MDGFRLDSADPYAFAKLFAPLMQEIATRYWLINSESGPFRITEKENFEELDAQSDAYYVGVPHFENSSQGLWRPGIFPTLADLLVVDEWTYLIGISGPEQKAIAAAQRIGVVSPTLSNGFFKSLQAEAAIFLMHVDGWWEIYSTDTAFTDKLPACGQVTPITSQRWEDEAKGLYRET